MLIECSLILFTFSDLNTLKRVFEKDELSLYMIIRETFGQFFASRQIHHCHSHCTNHGCEKQGSLHFHLVGALTHSEPCCGVWSSTLWSWHIFLCQTGDCLLFCACICAEKFFFSLTIFTYFIFCCNEIWHSCPSVITLKIIVYPVNIWFS